MDLLPPLSALRAFEAAGRLKSIRRAALELCVTPAAISRQVRALEDCLGHPLFTRGHRAISLTPTGEQYLRDVSRFFGGLRASTAALTETKGRRTLNIRSYTTFSMRWLIPRLSSFLAANPDIDVRLTTSLEWVDFGREDVDAAIRLGPGNWDGLRADRLVSNVLVPVCSPKLLETPHHLMHPKQLDSQMLLHSLARPDDWAAWLTSAGAAEVNAYDGQKYESSALALQAAIQGQGVAVAQKVLVEDDLASGRLCKPFDHELDMGHYTYYLVVPIRRPETCEMLTFRRWIKGQAS